MRTPAKLLAIVAASALSGAAVAPMPDPAKTPGVDNPAVTQANIRQTICVPGWSKKQRPPASYTTALKRKQLPAGARLADFEEDHLESIEVGGSPTDPRNLWPQPWNGPYGAHVKDKAENAVHKAICSGKITLDDGRHGLAKDWRVMYRRFVGPLP